MYIPVDYSGSVYFIEALFDIGQLRGSRWKGSSVNGNKKDITGYALVAYLVWPPINRTIVTEVDTNINFSADICIGKEQPTAINYTDGCWYGTSSLNLVVLCFSLTVTLTFPIRHCDQKCNGERFAV